MRLPYLGLALLMGAACTQKTTAPATEGTAAPATEEKMAASDETAAVEMTPPAREDDAERKSKNGKLEAEVSGVDLIVTYGRPKVNGREIFGELIPYGEVWRTGADEATTISFAKAVMFEGKHVEPGTYALFTIPGEKEWKVILNEQAKQWGAYKRDPAKDLVTVTVKPEASEETTEELTFSAEDDGIVIAWADVKVPVTIEGH